MRHFLPAILFAVFAGVTAFAGGIAPPGRGEVAIMFPPFTSEETAWAIVKSAGGQFVGPTRLPNIVVAYAPDTQFHDRARAAGAVLFLHAEGLCAPLTETQT